MSGPGLVTHNGRFSTHGRGYRGPRQALSQGRASRGKGYFRRRLPTRLTLTDDSSGPARSLKAGYVIYVNNINRII